ncbi:hypothetical protein ACIRU3_44775 [Streptomyces sp. NPDC101151]
MTRTGIKAALTDLLLNDEITLDEAADCRPQPRQRPLRRQSAKRSHTGSR